jgi:hypothetical protein
MGDDLRTRTPRRIAGDVSSGGARCDDELIRAEPFVGLANGTARDAELCCEIAP